MTGVKYGVEPSQIADIQNNTHQLPHDWSYYSGTSQTDYELDGVGNRKTVIRDGQTETYVTNSVNEYVYVNNQRLMYDQNGNLLDDGEHRLYYNHNNQVVKADRYVSDPTFQHIKMWQYDVLGRRLKVWFADQTVEWARNMSYDGQRLLAEWWRISPSATTWLRIWVYGNGIDEVLVDLKKGVWYLDDALGSTYAISDPTGSVLEMFHYSVFGLPSLFDGSGDRKPSGSILARRVWRAMEYEEGIGILTGAEKPYAPELGCFLVRQILPLENRWSCHYTIERPAPGNALWPFSDKVPLLPVTFRERQKKIILAEDIRKIMPPESLRFLARTRIEQNEVDAWVQKGKQTVDLCIENTYAYVKNRLSRRCCIPNELVYVPDPRASKVIRMPRGGYKNEVAHWYGTDGSSVVGWCEIMQAVFDIVVENRRGRNGVTRAQFFYSPRIPDWWGEKTRLVADNVEWNIWSYTHLILEKRKERGRQILYRLSTPGEARGPKRLKDVFSSPSRFPFRIRIWAKASLMGFQKKATAVTFVEQVSDDFLPGNVRGSNRRRANWL